MNVYGVGAHFPGEKKDLTRKFISNGRFVIGYSEEAHPDYYKTLGSVKTGDILFIKSRFMNNKPLTVKAVGIVTDSNISLENGLEGRKGIKVNWVKDLSDNPIKVSKDNRNDGSTSTIYLEKDESIINQVLSLLD